jgi:hypothetical protein
MKAAGSTVPKMDKPETAPMMLFKSKPERLKAKRQRIEDEIVGYIISRKQPPGRLIEMASQIKMDLELMQGRR